MIATASLLRTTDGTEVASEGHAGGSGGARAAFDFYGARWRDRGLLLHADADTLTIWRHADVGHIMVVRWHDA